MLIKCRECGANVSSLAKSCPKCGCPNKSTGKGRIAVTSLVLGIFDVIYAFAFCVSAYKEQKNFEFVFMVIILTILSTFLGVVSLPKTKNKSKPIVGIILGTASAVLTSIASIV